MKKLLLLSGLFLSNLTYADNVIYKCTSSTGEVTYQNNMGNKNECTKTNFASFPNINIFKADSVKKTTSHSSNNNGGSNFIGTNVAQEKNNNISEDQKLRDTKRVLILTQELNQEKEQLNTVSLMLKNLKDTNSKDTNQIAQLEELKNSHVNNITAIERELGNSKNLVKVPELKIEKATLEPNLNSSTMMVTKALSAPSMLPTSLPNTTSSSNNNIKNNVVVIKNEPLKIIKPVNNLNENSINKKNTIKTSAMISSPKTSKNVNEELRRSNSLGKSMTYASGLSGMSKVKK